ncbi:isochorismate synthase, partial [Proteus mirabilis]
MEKINPVFSTLYEKVKNINLTAQGNLLHLKVTLPADVSFSLLSWLAAQSCYPQFYWQHRDENEEVAACGQLCCFNNIQDARQFLSAHQSEHNIDDVRIWGLNAWDTIIPGRIDKIKGDDAYLFLPRIEIRRHQQQLSVHLNMLDEDDKQNTLDFLQTLNQAVEIEPLSVSVTHVNHSLTQEQWTHYL